MNLCTKNCAFIHSGIQVTVKADKKCCLVLGKRDHKLVFGQDTAAKIVMVWGSVIFHIGKHVDRMRLLCTCETCDPSLLHLICPLPCHFKYTGTCIYWDRIHQIYIIQKDVTIQCFLKCYPVIILQKSLQALN